MLTIKRGYFSSFPARFLCCSSFNYISWSEPFPTWAQAISAMDGWSGGHHCLIETVHVWNLNHWDKTTMKVELGSFSSSTFTYNISIFLIVEMMKFRYDFPFVLNWSCRNVCFCVLALFASVSKSVPIDEAILVWAAEEAEFKETMSAVKLVAVAGGITSGLAIGLRAVGAAAFFQNQKLAYEKIWRRGLIAWKLCLREGQREALHNLFDTPNTEYT